MVGREMRVRFRFRVELNRRCATGGGDSRVVDEFGGRRERGRPRLERDSPLRRAHVRGMIARSFARAER